MPLPSKAKVIVTCELTLVAWVSYWCRRSLVPTRRINFSPYNRLIGWEVSGPHNFAQFTCHLATKSLDLTRLDYFVWRFSKSKMYANAPQIIEALNTKTVAIDPMIFATSMNLLWSNVIKRVLLTRKKRSGAPRIYVKFKVSTRSHLLQIFCFRSYSSRVRKYFTAVWRSIVCKKAGAVSLKLLYWIV